MPQMDGKQLKAGSIAEAKLASAFTDELIRRGGTVAFTADESMGGFKLTNLGTPTAAGDAATKSYTDSVAAGLDWKDSCRLASAAALPANTYNGGTKRLTASANGALSVDDVAVAVNDRVLVKNEVTGSNNGLYKVIQTGDGASPYILERTSDADTSAEVTSGIATFISEGTANADSGWTLTTNDPIVLDTTALTFTQFSGLGQVTAGAGLTKTGNTLDVGDAGKGVQVNVDSVEVDGSEVAGTGLEQTDAGANSHKVRIASAAAGNGLTGGSGSALAVLAQNDSVASAVGGVKAAVPTSGNKAMAASVTASDFDQATVTTVAVTPSGDGYVQVMVNGLQVEVGDGVKTKDCYFSADAGVTARAISAIAAADTMHWVGSVAGYQLAATDKIDWNYNRIV